MGDRSGLVVCIGCALTCLASSTAAEPGVTAEPPLGRFGYSLIDTPRGQPADVDFFASNETCAVCHPRQQAELQGSMHSATHNDPLYRGFAETARREAGEQVYTYCAACHAPIGVATGIIPATPEDQLSPDVKAGVTCDTCHHISALTGTDGPWKVEGNASFVLESDTVRFGPSDQVTENRFHTDEKRDYFAKSEFCASCHTVIHPTNGLPIENTYDEWKTSIYAEHGIQCQDCHMRTVKEAQQVAESLKPIARQGPTALNGPMRPVFSHYFVGGNANADHLAHGVEHAKMAEARLRGTARLELQAPATVRAGSTFRFEVAVENVAAGHHIPTGVTELRQIWIDLRLLDGNHEEIFRSGQLDEGGDFGPNTIWFGAVAADAAGKPTLRPWEMTRFLSHRTIPPKGVERELVSVDVPTGVAGPLTLSARLLYRSAAPKVAAEFMGDEAFVPKVTEMATSEVKLEVE